MLCCTGVAVGLRDSQLSVKENARRVEVCVKVSATLARPLPFTLRPTSQGTAGGGKLRTLSTSIATLAMSAHSLMYFLHLVYLHWPSLCIIYIVLITCVNIWLHS